MSSRKTARNGRLFYCLFIGVLWLQLSLISCELSAQNAVVEQDSVQRINVTGKVMYGATGEKLSGVHVFIGDNKRPVAVTDTAGLFQLWQMPVGKWYVVTISYVGYQNLVRRCLFSKAGMLPYPFKLKEALLDEV